MLIKTENLKIYIESFGSVNFLLKNVLNNELFR
jgi:hypothetical protein